jgi:hypothetical protein
VGTFDPALGKFDSLSELGVFDPKAGAGGINPAEGAGKFSTASELGKINTAASSTFWTTVDGGELAVFSFGTADKSGSVSETEGSESSVTASLLGSSSVGLKLAVVGESDDCSCNSTAGGMVDNLSFPLSIAAGASMVTNGTAIADPNTAKMATNA